jgi:hypothetical protein
VFPNEGLDVGAPALLARESNACASDMMAWLDVVVPGRGGANPFPG